jgi:molybdenum cofactor cytidylyltransferase
MTAGILLAAGESTRMGQLKALLPWRGTTLIQSQLDEMRAAELSPLLVVLGHRREELAPLVGEAQVIVNDRYREGKSTSIVAAARALQALQADAAILVAVDQPTEASVLRALSAAGGLIVIPSIDHRRGHPTLFRRPVLAELATITEEREGLREVMNRHEADIRYVDVDTDIVRANLNAPEDYEAAFARWGQR